MSLNDKPKLCYEAIRAIARQMFAQHYWHGLARYQRRDSTGIIDTFMEYMAIEHNDNHHALCAANAYKVGRITCAQNYTLWHNRGQSVTGSYNWQDKLVSEKEIPYIECNTFHDYGPNARGLREAPIYNRYMNLIGEDGMFMYPELAYIYNEFDQLGIEYTPHLSTSQLHCRLDMRDNVGARQVLLRLLILAHKNEIAQTAEISI
jgi:hypothetical protein